MEILSSLARVIVVAVFFIAVLHKAAAFKDFKTTLHDFEIPKNLILYLAVLILAAESITAVLLMNERTVQLGAYSALSITLLYSVAMARLLLQGKRPACNCFGQASSQPISGRVLIRNLFLMICCIAVAVEPYGAAHIRSNFSLPGDSNVSTILLAILVTLQFWMLYHLYKQNGRLLVQMDNVELRLKTAGVEDIGAGSDTALGLPVGALAPDFVLPALNSERPVASGELRSNSLPLFLIFSDVNCQPCSELIPRIGDWAERYANAVNVVVVTRGKTDKKALHRPDPRYMTLVQEGDEVSGLYKANATPSAVLIDSNGLIRSDVMLGSAAIERLLHLVGSADVGNRESTQALDRLPGFAGPQLNVPG